MDIRTNPKVKNDIKAIESIIIKNLDQSYEGLRKDTIEEMCSSTVKESKEEAEKYINIHEDLVKKAEGHLTEYDYNYFRKRGKTFKEELDYIKNRLSILCKKQ